MPTRRGRPPKFGRPSRAVVLTLPETVLTWLRSIHPDPAWGIVTLHDRLTGRPDRSTKNIAVSAEAELVALSSRRALIVVNPSVLRRLEGVSVIPLADGRALIALEPGRGAADLELAIVDRLDRTEPGSRDYKELQRLRLSLRRWRHQDGLHFGTRSIIVVERRPAQGEASLERPPKPIRLKTTQPRRATG